MLKSCNKQKLGAEKKPVWLREKDSQYKNVQAISLEKNKHKANGMTPGIKQA